MPDSQEIKNTTDMHVEEEAAKRIQKRLTFLMFFLAIFLLLSLIMNVILVIAFHKFPVTKFLWVSDAQAVCEAIPLNEPNISQARLKDFAANAAVSINTYDYANWRVLINASLSQFFTPRGRDRYRAELQKSSVIENVVLNYQVVTAITHATPNIVEEGMRAGRYFWVVEVPLRVSYRTNKQTLDENRLLTFTIIRVEPSPINSNGIAIDGAISSQMTLKDLTE